MADEPTGTGAPAATTSEPQAGASTTADPKPQAGAATSPQAGESISLDTKKKLDKENLQLRRERDDFAKKLKALEDAQLSETERLTKELAELKDQQATWLVEKRERDTRDAVIEAASDEKVGARNPRAIYRLIRDDLEFDDSGKVQNLDDCIKKAKAEYPELFGKANGMTGSVNGGAGGRGNAPPQDMNAVIRARMRGHA